MTKGSIWTYFEVLSQCPISGTKKKSQNSSVFQFCLREGICNIKLLSIRKECLLWLWLTVTNIRSNILQCGLCVRIHGMTQSKEYQSKPSNPQTNTSIYWW